jgi:hypothetical protein
MGIELGRIVASRKTGEESIRHQGRPTSWRLLDFWRWSASDLLGNTTRGVLAEYLVACDLGIASGARDEWGSYDLRTPAGVTIEVKASAYLQSWHQKKLSKIVFSIAPSRAWSTETGKSEASERRQADVYVFALLDHKEKETVDPVDLDQWRFFIVPTRRLDERHPRQNGISLARLRQLEPEEARFGGIASAVARVTRVTSRKLEPER